MDIDEETQIIIAAIKRPENVNNLVVKDVLVSGVLAKAICWISTDKPDIEMSPMVIVVNPEIFKQIELV